MNRLYYRGILPVVIFFVLMWSARSAPPPGYTQVYSGKFSSPTNVNSVWSGGTYSSLGWAGQGFKQALGYWEIALNSSGWGYWPDIWLSGSVDPRRVTNSAELGIVEAGAMLSIVQHVKVLSPQGQEVVTLLHTRPGGVSAGVHVFGCLIKADVITLSIDGNALWTVATPPEATGPLFALCNFVVAKVPPDPGAITAAVITCYAPAGH